ncbi:MAG: hypothetical protein Q9169_007694 [Polycauliona sp. 2 TL-2023]
MDPNTHGSDLQMRQPACDSCRRQRSKASSRQEQIITDLQSKVDRLSKSLHRPSESTNGTRAVENAPSAVAESCNPPPASQGFPTDPDSSFQGESSFMTHSKQVTQAFKDSLASTPQTNHDEALSDAVADLQQALDSSIDRPLSPSYPMESPSDGESHDLATLPMPPSSVVLKVLKRAKVSVVERPRVLDEYPAFDLPVLIGYCQKIFFATEPYSTGAFIIVNSSLVSLLRGLSERAKQDLHISQSDLTQYVESLTRNVDIAVNRLPLLFAHSLENVTALLSAVGVKI